MRSWVALAGFIDRWAQVNRRNLLRTGTPPARSTRYPPWPRIRASPPEELTPTDDEEQLALWQRTAEAALKDPAGWHGAAVPAQFLVLVT